MRSIDWIVLIGTLSYIILYGLWKSKGVNNTKDFLLGKQELKWWTIGLSIIATQASAITFLSTPGQAFEDGMRFIQFYLGMPLAMVILAAFVVPLYYKYEVYTAYQYLESRFDLRTRQLAAALFLIQRGLAAGIVIYAPAIILSNILSWNLELTILLMGAMVILYTVSGGTDAVSQTQKQQMIVILSGMFIAFLIMVNLLPDDISFGSALTIAGEMDKLNVIDFEFDLSNRYNVWSGLLGGTFLFLSYFGTDQSQVQRYLSGKSLKESRLGLIFNGLFKVPMQFMILLIGAIMFVFYQFNQPPLHFNKNSVNQIRLSEYKEAYEKLEERQTIVFNQKQVHIRNFLDAKSGGDGKDIQQARMVLDKSREEETKLRTQAKEIMGQVKSIKKAREADYVFITFILTYLPPGLVGLLIAVIFSAAMSTTASELNALATTTTIDFYQRSWAKNKEDKHYLFASKGFTILWGLIALSFAMVAGAFDNLIEAVNIVGSVFYGAILGIFLTAFFLPYIRAKAIFMGALIGEILVITVFVLDKMEKLNIAYLWLNLIGCILVILLAAGFQFLLKEPKVNVPLKNKIDQEDILDSDEV